MKYISDEKSICSRKTYTNNGHLDAILIGHIRLKEDAEKMRRLCFNGFYTKSPSNGAFYASTWKNWDYLNKFATLYNLIFIPTVGPGYKEKKKNLKKGNLHRDRSNGQYFGYAWRTAINNHIGFINIASYNNWLEGTQIEEAIPKTGYDNYEPGLPNKYLDLTANWVNSFLSEKRKLLGKLNCYNFLNNTIC